MAKTHSWAPRAPEILARVAASSRQSWRRIDIERLFEVKRATAQTLMKLIGGLHLVGATHLVDRSSLLSFLEEVLEAPTASPAAGSPPNPCPAAAASASCTPPCLPISTPSWPATCHRRSRCSPAHSSSPAPTRLRSLKTSSCSCGAPSSRMTTAPGAMKAPHTGQFQGRG